MIADCLKSQSGFGVVAIREGQEVGSLPVVYSFGVEARIIDWDQLTNGLLGIVVKGERRFRIENQEIDRAQMTISAAVEWMEESAPVAIPEERRGLMDLLAELANHQAAEQFGVTSEAQSAQALAWNLLQVAPIPIERKVDLLELNDPIDRLHQLSLEIDRLAKH